MSSTALRASLRLWKSRLAYRKRQHAKWVKKEGRAQATSAKNKAHQKRKKWTRLTDEAERMVKHRRRQLAVKEDSRYGGSRGVTNKVIRIVDGRAPVTSRKRAASHPLSVANPSSDHSGLNRTADAVDFGTANNHALKHEISRELGGPSSLADYGSFVTRLNGRSFRVQIIAGTHGTGPHLHVGVRRI